MFVINESKWRKAPLTINIFPPPPSEQRHTSIVSERVQNFNTKKQPEADVRRDNIKAKKRKIQFKNLHSALPRDVARCSPLTTRALQCGAGLCANQLTARGSNKQKLPSAFKEGREVSGGKPRTHALRLPRWALTIDKMQQQRQVQQQQQQRLPTSSSSSKCCLSAPWQKIHKNPFRKRSDIAKQQQQCCYWTTQAATASIRLTGLLTKPKANGEFRWTKRIFLQLIFTFFGIFAHYFHFLLSLYS